VEKVEKREEQIVINLIREDVFTLQSGKIVHEGRTGVITPDATIDIMPLSVIDPSDDSLEGVLYTDNRLEKAMKAPLRAVIFPNEDLQVFIPAIKLTDVRLTDAELPKESVETPIAEDRDALLNAIPKKGIKINFVNSLKSVKLLVG
jgi:hypothetical protein